MYRRRPKTVVFSLAVAAVLLAMQHESSLSAGASPAAANLAAGEQSYAKCIGCHSPDRNRTGPLHCGLVGREAGAVPDYAYSDAMRASGIVWTVDALDRFLRDPLQMVPGSTMGFAGIADAAERRDLVAWLATLTESSAACATALKRPAGTSNTPAPTSETAAPGGTRSPARP